MTGSVSPTRDRSRSKRRYLSTDVEDIVLSAAELHESSAPAGYVDNLGRDIERTLEVMAAADVRATWFINGRYCEQYDSLMRDVVGAGHVLATHGHVHRDVRRLSVTEFNDDLKRSIDALSRYQPRILGYRPPAFTMPFDHEHLRVLSDVGLQYVSCGALFPRANVPHEERPIRLDGGLLYIPVSMTYPLGRRIPYPVGYGHVSRLLPEWFVIPNLRRIAGKADFFQFYFHPYELNGLPPGTRTALNAVKSGDIPQRIYSLRCVDRSRLFARIFNACNFEPLETMEELGNGKHLESRIG